MRIGDLAARVWTIYLCLTAVCAVGLWVLGMSPFDAICHSFCAISTGGFANYDASIGHFQDPAIEVWLMIFMVIGGTNFLLYVALTERRWQRLRHEEEFRYYILFLLLSSLAIFWSLSRGENTGQGWVSDLRDSAFQVISIMTTTGFSTKDFSQWPHFCWVILLLLMGFGGSTGSTSGGIKISRWLVFIKLVWYQINSSFRPTIINTLKLNGGRLPQDQINQALFLICLSWVTLGFGTATVAALQPNLDFVSVFSGVIACLFNIGPGLEALGPASNYADLKPLTKYFLAFLMALGRLEFFAILVLFVPALWRRY
jgi:trk system potassium uptake protein TrkH